MVSISSLGLRDVDVSGWFGDLTCAGFLLL